jgi:hypothetical protein
MRSKRIWCPKTLPDRACPLRCSAYLYDSKIIPDVLDGVAEAAQRVEMELSFSQVPVKNGDLVLPEQVGP